MKRLSILCALALAVGCDGGTESSATARRSEGPVVYTTMYPVAWLTERLVGSAVDVVCPVPEDADAIFWEPPRDVLEAYRAADLVVANGAEFAKWLANASLPESRLVRSADGFADEFLRFETTTHSHGPGGDHTHEGVDGHTWVDPENARRQARAIAAALSARWTEHADAFAANLTALEADLDRLATAWRELDAALQAANLICSHPAYDYLLRRYGWSATNLDLDPDAPLDAAARSAVREAVDGARPNVLIWESEPGPATRDALAAELGVASVVVSPVEVLAAADRAAGRDYLSIQLAAIDALRATLE